VEAGPEGQNFLRSVCNSLGFRGNASWRKWQLPVSHWLMLLSYLPHALCVSVWCGKKSKELLYQYLSKYTSCSPSLEWNVIAYWETTLYCLLKVKLCLSWSKQDAIKAYWRVEVRLHAFLIQVLEVSGKLFTLRRPYLQGKSNRYLLGRKLADF
jgi:hypothetical protein